MSHIRRFTQQAQVQTQWCWAAVAVSTSLCYDLLSTWTQCLVANAVLSVGGCCSNELACNVPSSLSAALTQTGNLQAGSPIDHAISRQAVRDEIDADRPVPIRLLNADGVSAHFVVITGYDDRGDGEIELTIQDPWGPQLLTTGYEDLASGRFGRRWTHTYLTL